MSGGGNLAENMFFTAFTSPGYMQLEAIVLASFTACQDHRSYEAKTLLLLQLLLLLLLLAPGSWLLAPGSFSCSWPAPVCCSWPSQSGMCPHYCSAKAFGKQVLMELGTRTSLKGSSRGGKGELLTPPPPPRVHFASLAIQTPMHTGLSPACPQEVRLLLIK